MKLFQSVTEFTNLGLRGIWFYESTDYTFMNFLFVSVSIL